MSWNWLLDAASGAFGMGVNWWVQSALLISAGLAVGAVCRRRGSATQSAVYRTTLAAAIGAPIATLLLSQAGVSGWSLAMPTAWTMVQPSHELPVVPEIHSAPENSSQLLEPNSQGFAATGAREHSDPSQFMYDHVASASVVTPAADPHLPSPPPAPASASSSAVTPTARTLADAAPVFALRPFGILACAGAVVWLVAAGTLVTRLFVAWRRLIRIRSRAAHAEDEAQDACRSLAKQLGVVPPPVLRSPYLPSPCLTGLRRPAVLLPEISGDLPVHDVLAHELAHLSRGDCYWNLLRQLTSAALFFQPLVWLLSRRLEATAEEVCDDYVVHLGGDRRGYAHRLVDIAELSLAPFAPAGVGIVSLRSMLGQRVARIMDTSRALSTQVGRAILALVLAGGLVGTLTAGLVGLDGDAKMAADGAPGGAGDAKAVEDKTPADESTSKDVENPIVKVEGRVVGPNEKPIAGAAVRAIRVLFDTHRPTQSLRHDILATATTDADGRFAVEFPREAKIEKGWLQTGWHVVASSPGLGPGWIRDAQAYNKGPVTLRLAADVPVQGRVVDLEGHPVEGVAVRVRRLARAADPAAIDKWIKESREREVPEDMTVYFAGAMNDRYANWFPSTWEDGDLADGSPALSAEVKTDAEGRFEIRGLGADRLAILEFVGATVAKSLTPVVTRDMETMAARPPQWVGIRSATYYGRTFEFVAEPTQPIVGTATDEETGEPLADVEIRLGQFAHNLFSQDDFLTTRTDAQGRFRLEGAPAGGGHRIDIEPTIDQPYFPTDKTLPESRDGFAPLTCDFALRRGRWITGRVTEAGSDKPIAKAFVEYLPLRENKHATSYPNYDPQITGAAPSQRFQTIDDGTFRVLAIPGAGLLTAAVDWPDREKYMALPIDGFPERLVLKSGYTNTYLPWTVTGANALCEVNLQDAEEEGHYDMALTRGLERLLKFVDAEGKPVSGVRVLGRVFPPKLEDSLKGPDAKVIGLRSDDKRILVALQPERRLGAALTIAPGEELTVTLEACGVAKGRVVDELGEPCSGLDVNVSVDGPDNWGRGLINGKTDAKGEFEVLLPPGTTSRVGRYSPGGPNFSAECRPEPGAVFQLGDLKDEAELTIEQTSKMLAATAEQPAVAEDKLAPGVGDSGNTDVLQFSGSVVTPDGKSAADADLFVVFYVPQPAGLLAATWKPVGRTDDKGRFQISLDARKLGTGARRTEVLAGSLAAVKDGYGFAFAPSGLFEASGQWLKSARERLKESPAELVAELRQLLGNAGEPLRLSVDDAPLSGRIVDINGEGVSGARVTLLEIWTDANNDLTNWRSAAKAPNADYYSARTKTPVYLNGPQVRSLVAPVLSDAQGRFTMRGVGRGRIAELLIEGPTIESARIFARTEAGEAIKLPRDKQSPEIGTYTYFPAVFTHVAGPSVPIVGTVRDAATKGPLSGVTVKSQSRHGEAINGWGQDFVRAVTDNAGHYRLVGMPVGEGNRIAALAPDGKPYFSVSRAAATHGNQDSATVDFDLARGAWVEGRVIDKQSGRGLAGQLEYFVARGNKQYGLARSFNVDERDRLQSDDEGRFRIAALPGLGYVSFLAFEHEDYPRADAILKADGSTQPARAMIETGPSILMASNAHVVAEIDPPADADHFELNLQLESRKIVGHVVDEQGKPLTGFTYSGRLAAFGVWDAGRGDEFDLVGYDAKEPRTVYFAHTERALAGVLVVSGSAQDKPLARLQPAGSVRGRLVDNDGAPLAEMFLYPWSPVMSSPADFDRAAALRAPPLPPNDPSSRQGQYETDDDGRFEITGLAPGIAYRLNASSREGMTPERGRAPLISGPVDRVIRVEPGQTLDLGDVRLADRDAFTAEAERQ